MSASTEWYSEEWFEQFFAELETTAVRLEAPKAQSESRYKAYATGPVMLECFAEQDGDGWIASSPALPGCVANGETEAAAVRQLIVEAHDWQDPGKGYGWTLHTPLALWRKRQRLIGGQKARPLRQPKFNGPAMQRGRDEYRKRWIKAFDKAVLYNREWDWSQTKREIVSGYHFSPLTEEEWSSVLETIHAANPPAFDETAVRQYVNWAGEWCGLFADDGELHFNKHRHFRVRLVETRELIAKIEKFLPSLSSFIADRANDDERTDRHFDELDFRLMELLLRLRSKEASIERCKSSLPKPRGNRATPPELESWQVGLVRVWTDKLQLPAENTQELQRFMLACLKPYGVGIVSNAAVKAFITKLLNGKVAGGITKQPTGKITVGLPSLAETLSERIEQKN